MERLEKLEDMILHHEAVLKNGLSQRVTRIEDKIDYVTQTMVTKNALFILLGSFSGLIMVILGLVAFFFGQGGK